MTIISIYTFYSRCTHTSTCFNQKLGSKVLWRAHGRSQENFF